MYSDLRAKKIEDTKMTESVPTNTYKAYKFDIKHSNLSERSREISRKSRFVISVKEKTATYLVVKILKDRFILAEIHVGVRPRAFLRFYNRSLFLQQHRVT